MSIRMLSVAMIASGYMVLAGCATGPSPTGIGLYTNVKGPVMATSQPGTKIGMSCARSVLGLVNTGNASIDAAKKAGNITTVSSVDYDTQGMYPFYGTTCLIVKGE